MSKMFIKDGLVMVNFICHLDWVRLNIMSSVSVKIFLNKISI
jgi:hypothetical protein